ncbi:MAG: CDGSH iron-sulfur domain-containing protein [Gammaproteobacteria bacterium]|nr:CDGSH iron-sulfur domain-containing protein [Gammaproteobacteria bacterium]
MSNKPTQHSYANEKIRVSFDGSKCAHAGLCFGQLHDVFNGDANPPINLKGAPLDEIIRVVELCPSSALTFERLDGEANEVTPEHATAVMLPKGPLALRGALNIEGQHFTRLTLCRCGQSKNKPFCDGSHHRHDFDDQAEVEKEEVKAVFEASTIDFTSYPDGPIGFSGELRINDLTGAGICHRSKGALCRCGASKRKPFCDGSHNEIGFKS